MSSKMAEMKAKMAALKKRREDGAAANHSAVVEEDRVAKLPANHESRKRRVEWEMEEEEKKKAAAARGEDYERIKYKDMSAMEADRRDRKKAKKAAGKDAGFTTYAAASYRQYERLTKQMKPDVRAYKKSQDEWGDDSTEAGSLAYGHHDRVSGEGLEAMVADLKKQDEKRKNFSRRRAHHHDADIDYINERNRNFNKKLERFYGKHTQALKDDLERGTAI